MLPSVFFYIHASVAVSMAQKKTHSLFPFIPKGFFQNRWSRGLERNWLTQIQLWNNCYMEVALVIRLIVALNKGTLKAADSQFKPVALVSGMYLSICKYAKQVNVRNGLWPWWQECETPKKSSASSSASKSASPINGCLVTSLGVQYMLIPSADIQHRFTVFHQSNNLQ